MLEGPQSTTFEVPGLFWCKEAARFSNPPPINPKIYMLDIILKEAFVTIAQPLDY